MNRTFGKLCLGTITLAGFLGLSVATPTLRADDDDCQRRVVRADHQLHEAAEHHGWDSPQAQRARERLQEARRLCWERGHRWWDEDAKRWHTDRDWDDHDHEHPHDQDRPH